MEKRNYESEARRDERLNEGVRLALSVPSVIKLDCEDHPSHPYETRQERVRRIRADLDAVFGK
jgi:hypothetical protein